MLKGKKMPGNMGGRFRELRGLKVSIVPLPLFDDSERYFVLVMYLLEIVN